MSSKKPDTQTRILAATWRLMVQNNGLGVRMSDIAVAVGISRQALYLHFSSRMELMIATTHYVDQVKGLDARLKRFRSLTDGVALLEEYVNGWANYIPEIYGLGKVLIRLRETDEAAAAAWDDRMGELRNGCQKIIEALSSEGNLAPQWTSCADAVNMFWTILSVHNWEQLVIECGWSTEQYIARTTALLKRSFVSST